MRAFKAAAWKVCRMERAAVGNKHIVDIIDMGRLRGKFHSIVIVEMEKEPYRSDGAISRMATQLPILRRPIYRI